MIFINDSRGHERIFQSRERGRGGWGGCGDGGDGGDGGIGKEEVIYWLFFFFFCGLLSQTGQSIPNEAGIGPEIFKY